MSHDFYGWRYPDLIQSGLGARAFNESRNRLLARKLEQAVSIVGIAAFDGDGERDIRRLVCENIDIIVASLVRPYEPRAPLYEAALKRLADAQPFTIDGRGTLGPEVWARITFAQDVLGYVGGKV